MCRVNFSAWLWLRLPWVHDMYIVQVQYLIACELRVQGGPIRLRFGSSDRFCKNLPC